MGNEGHVIKVNRLRNTRFDNRYQSEGFRHLINRFITLPMSYVCSSVCALAYLRSQHVQISPTSLCKLPVAVARSSSGGVAIRYVLPVLWISPTIKGSGCVKFVHSCSFSSVKKLQKVCRLYTRGSSQCLYKKY